MKRIVRSKIILASSALAMFATACVGGEEALEIADSSYESTTAMSAEGRYIVKFKDNQGRSAALAAGKLALDLPAHNAMAMHLPDAQVRALRSNPTIEYVEVDAVRMPLAETVPYGVPMVQADLVAAAPANGDAGRVKVCIIDSGLQASHEDFAGQSIAGTDDSGTGSWSTDLCGHGTHVAGTIAAVTGNGIGVASVAHSASSLHIVKVFGDDCAWTYSSSLVAALDVCTANGAKIVSMSLGGSFKSNTEDSAFSNANANGVLSIAAAGNDGTTGLSYPASYTSVMSVAALDSTKTVAAFSQHNSQVEIAAPGVGVVSTYPYEASLTVGTTKYSGSAIEFSASGSASGALVDGGLCDTTGAWSGKTVLCERGVISFYDKVMNVQNSGGATAVIYNNVSGGFLGTLGEGNSSTIPAISLSQEDGQALVAGSLGQTGAVNSGLGHGYAALDGTSMATPHVSAVAALVWAQFPTATNADIRGALNATAEDLGAAGRDNYYGNGLVQAAGALDYLVNGGGGTDPVCLPAGDSCTANSDCCSNSCKGPSGRKTCK